jgi:hypothetical protein
VIQRWITGGNSSGTFSGQSDPFLGVPQPGDPRTFAFSHEGATLRMDLNDKAAKPFVQLQWGTYLFVPSIKALAALRDKAAAATTAPAAPSLWSVKVGEAYIQKLLQAEKLGAPGMSQQWKALLEDISARSSNTSASVWAAIRENHGGVLRTPYGVLVAGKDLVMQVFQNASGHYSVSGYAHRMRQSFGEIYLGLDDGEAYDTQATAVNKALMDVSKPEAFAIAHAATQSFLTQAIGAAKAQAQHMGSPVWDLSLDMKDMSDAVLAGLCDHWFGLPDDNHRIDAGGWQWNWKPEDPPRCPGHFLSPSRYMFQPQPGPSATSFGQDHGQTLLAAFKLLVNDHRSNSSMPTAPLAQKLFAAFADTPESNDLLASTFIGVLMGFLPTVDGNLRATLYEWMNDRSLWDLQNTLMQNPKDAYQRALDVLQLPLMRTMQLRPVPEVVWRTATSPHRLGSGDTAVDIVPGDIVVVGIVSSTQAELAAPRASGCPMHVTNATNVFPVFGGDRRATPHPTHACPAYEMAMGVLLGMISALLECGTMRPTPSPLILNWRGRVQPEGSGQTAA